MTEGNSGTKNAGFLVTLSALSGLPASVDFATAPGTATPGSDYTAVTGTLTIPVGHLTGTINIPIKGDAVVEDDETFFVNLSNPVNVTIADTQGQGTILNDDVPGDAQFSAAVYRVSEASTSATVTVRRLNGKAAGATVDYATADGTATGAGNQDYTPTSGTLTFAANRTSASFKIPITRDLIDEGDETVLLRLSPSGGPTSTGVGAQSTAVLVIRDNDTGGKIRLSSANYSVSEGAGSVKITVKRSGGRAGDVAVHYATSPGTAAGGGTDDLDATGDLTFATSGAGAAIQSITIPITQDLLPEGAETFQVTLSSPTGGGVLVSPSVATVTILDDESTVEFGAEAYSAKETQANALVTVKRSGPTTDVMTVDYATGGGTATPDVDYKSASGTLTFTKGVTTRSFVVPMIKDTLVEGDETVERMFSNPVGTVVGGRSAAQLTIVDDDATPTLQFSAATYKVNESMPKATITVKRTGNVARAVTVEYAITGGTATNGGVDYDLPATGTLTFGARVDDPDDPGAAGERRPGRGDGDGAPGPAEPTGRAGPGRQPRESRSHERDGAGHHGQRAHGAVFHGHVQGQRGGEITDRHGEARGRPHGHGDRELRRHRRDGYSGHRERRRLLDHGPRDPHLRTEAIAPEDPHRREPGYGVGGKRDHRAGAVRADRRRARHTQRDRRDDQGQRQGRQGPVQRHRLQRGRERRRGDDHRHPERGTSSEATVQKSTSDGSAVAGTDYTATSGTLTFGLRQTSATFTVPVIDDGTPNGGAVSVDFVLDTPDNGLALGSVPSATLWIVRE